jgi:hypothetical protein
VRSPDLAIVCLASFRHVIGYPDEYLEHLNPKSIIVGHWEDFFRPTSRPPKVVRMTNAKKFINRLPDRYKGEEMFMPTPGTCISFKTDQLTDP